MKQIMVFSITLALALSACVYSQEDLANAHNECYGRGDDKGCDERYYHKTGGSL